MSVELEKLTFDDRDEYERKQVAERAIALLRSDIEASPMVIDGGWGAGKTEFCMKMMNLMRASNEFRVIYVDAFKADHADEPLLTLLAEVVDIIPSGAARESFIEKAVPVIRFGLKTLAKASISHVLRKDADGILAEYEEEINDAANLTIDATIKALLSEHAETERCIQTLQGALEKLAEQRPIAIFIDELDRCRPDFALKMLEVIKHTFDVAGLNFILITNTQQLKASIVHRYGNEIDAQRYLDKFVKFAFRLPTEMNWHGTRNTTCSVVHCRALIGKSGSLSALSLLGEDIFPLIEQVIRIHNLSLREVQTLVRHLEIYHLIGEQKGLDNSLIYGYKLLRIAGLLIYCVDPDLARSIAEERVDAKNIGEFFGVSGIAVIDLGKDYTTLCQEVAVMLGQDSTYNSEFFTPSEEPAIGQWREIMKRNFGGRFSGGDRRKLGIVRDAIESFSFLYVRA